MSPDAQGEIITFYSFKGGTGRSMAVANAAWILASSGKRVLVLDWDLESPGLLRYFHPFLVDKSLRTSTGVIDLVWDFSSAAMETGHDGDPGWLAERAEVERYAVSLDWDFPGEGTVDFVPAGRQNGSYSGRVSAMDWDTLYSRQGGGEFFAQLRDNMKRNYDYVLIDSRTGLSDTAGICTMALPDTVVNCFTMNGQSIEGAADVANSIRSRASRPIRIVPVPMRIEDAEQGKLEAGRDYVHRVFAPFLDHLDGLERERFWGEIEVPYKPFYAYEEILATIGDRPLQENSLLASYERLVGVLTGGAVTRLAAVVDEADRRRWLEEFERTKQPAATDVFISHVEQDRMWADWLAHQLTSVGYEVSLQGTAFPPGSDLETELRRAISGASCTLAVISPDYLKSTIARIAWDAALTRDRIGSQGLLVPVKVTKFDTWGRYSSRVPVDLTNLNAEAAVDEVLAAVHDPGLRPSGHRRPEPSDVAPPRFPGSQPLVLSLPLRNPHFVGRDAELLKLRQRLTSSPSAVVVPQAVSGLGGVGKTQLVQEYAYRFSADYDVVWWIPASQPAEARAKLAALAPLLLGAVAGGEATDPDAGDTGQLIRAVLTALRRGDPYRDWLVIFDNAENPDEIAPLTPIGPGHVIITTRNQDWGADKAELVGIDVFSRAESVELLKRRGQPMSDQDADRLADRLGDLPLALEQAAVWLSETGMSVQEYLQLFDEHERANRRRETPVGLEDRSETYPASVAATWSIVFERLRVDAPASLQLLELCAFFGPEPIPFRVLRFGHRVGLPEPLASSLADSIRRRRAVREIGRYALAKIDPASDTVQVHRLVQAVLRASVTPEQRRAYIDSVHALITLANPGSPDTRNGWPQLAELSAHVVPTTIVDSTDSRARKVVLDQVRYRYRRGDFEGSRDLAVYARQHWNERLGADDEQTLLVSRHLADALWWLGKYEEARLINEDTIDRLARIYGEEHEHMLATRNSIGAGYRVQGRFADARRLDESNLAVHRRVYGDDAPETLRCCHNLAVDLRLLGDFGAAYDLDEETLRRRNAVLDPKDSSILATTVNLARDVYFLGDFPGALQMMRTALERFAPVFTNDHPEMLSANRALSGALRMAGNYDLAAEASQENLALYRARFGPDQQQTLDAMVIAGNNQRAVGDLSSARRLLEAALTSSRALFTEEHFFTQAAAVDLAVVERAQGDLESAAVRIDRALDVFRRLHGPDHFFTVATLANRASDLAARGQHQAAREVSAEVAGIAARTRGPNHPDTLLYLVNLSIDQQAAGDSDGQLLFEDTLARLAQVLGPEHPVFIDTAAGRRAEFDIETPAI
jgi:cellulose biosynthesis protein BcsQ/tetratricopeptide (TPR) repeat protein